MEAKHTNVRGWRFAPLEVGGKIFVVRCCGAEVLPLFKFVGLLGFIELLEFVEFIEFIELLGLLGLWVIGYRYAIEITVDFG